MNMFTGVVVESFAYVYQMPGGPSLNREEMSESNATSRVGVNVGRLVLNAVQGHSRGSGRISTPAEQATYAERISSASSR